MIQGTKYSDLELSYVTNQIHFLLILFCCLQCDIFIAIGGVTEIDFLLVQFYAKGFNLSHILSSGA